MRHIIFWSLLLTLVGWNLSCTKETTETKPINKPDTIQDYYNTDMDAVTIGRDGVYYPFMSPYSIVRYDVFTKTLYIYNIADIDSVLFVRQSTAISVYLGVHFSPYEAIIYYTDGSTESIKALAPTYLGTKSIVIPDDDYNQLDPSHPDHLVTIQRTSRRTQEYHAGCGVPRWKWYYLITCESGTAYTQQIEGRCDLSLDYKLIF